MFERFTDRARRVVVLAQEEARLLDHDYIGTEHLLLGLIHESEGVAAKVLESLGISLEEVRTEVQAAVGRGVAAPEGHIAFTPRAKKVLELSLREALQLGHNYIGTEHILLGLIREGRGVAAQVLTRLGADMPLARERTIQLLTGDSARGRSRESLAGVPYEAALLAEGRPAESDHFLLALFADPESRAARALQELGVTRQAVEAALAGLDPPSPPGEGTSPREAEAEPPPDAGGEGQAPAGA